MRPIERVTFDAATLMADHPPRLRHANKRVVFEIACPPGAAIGGSVHYSRWSAEQLPARMSRPAPDLIVTARGWYSYGTAAPGATSTDPLIWHVNFADPELFGYYGGAAFAQDEVQVAEHPVLASVREALLASGSAARTEEAGHPTPVLVRGAERRVAIGLDIRREAGVEGHYGRRFGAADPETVARATRRLDPPTITNILAIAAPAYGLGPYASAEIEEILRIAYTGFRAAAVESREHAGASGTHVHTGYWGGGAFGGDRELLTLLQLTAAEVAGIDRLVFWTGSPGGEEPFERAMSALDELIPAEGIETAELVSAVLARGYRWATGDGN